MSKYTVPEIMAEADMQDDHVADMLRDYAALLHERESAKAAVTDEIRAHASFIYRKTTDGNCNELGMLNALEAVAPMLASARVPDGWQLVPVEATDEMCEAAWESDASDYVGEHRRIHHADLAYKAMLAVAPKPETEE